MTNSTRICKVCGKEYPYCKTILKEGEIFRWQDVACCQEHGSKYFSLILASRAEDNKVKTAEQIANVNIPEENDDDNEEEYEDDFVDDDEDDE